MKDQFAQQLLPANDESDDSIINDRLTDTNRFDQANVYALQIPAFDPTSP